MSSKVHLKKEDRRFMKPKSISTFLKCSICYEIYYEPLRLFCGYIDIYPVTLSVMNALKAA